MLALFSFSPSKRFQFGPYGYRGVYLTAQQVTWNDTELLRIYTEKLRAFLPPSWGATSHKNWSASFDVDEVATAMYTAAAAGLSSRPVVRRFGTGMNLLSALLRPILWR